MVGPLSGPETTLSVVGVVQRLARQLVELKMGVRFPSPTLMSNENITYLISTGAFSGRDYFGVNKYLNKGKLFKKNRPSGQKINTAWLTTDVKSGQRGRLTRILIRPDSSPSSPKTKVALFTPNNLAEFNDYAKRRQLSVTESSEQPIEIALSLYMQSLARSERDFNPAGNFRESLLRLSTYPPQNLITIQENIIAVAEEKRPFRFGCFACLSIISFENNGLPQIKVVSDGEIRVLSPNITKRTEEIISVLNKTKFSFEIKYFLANTDPYEIYQSPLNYVSQVDATLDRIKKGINRNIAVSKWSDIQSKYPSSECDIIIDEQDIDSSVQRRLNYYEQKGFKITAKLEEYSRDCAKRLIKSYAKQGPLIEQECDCLIILDPDPLKFGRWQSILSPKLPILYLYSG